jgi:hypothetical protein
MKKSRSLRTTIKSAIVAALGAAVVGVVAAPALAVGYGNTVLNCRGMYYNTAWGQECPSPGAKFLGNYKSKGNCTYQSDPTLTVKRSVGSTAPKYGPSCTFSVIAVDTEYIGS